jgi:hypothetical protein
MSDAADADRRLDARQIDGEPFSATATALDAPGPDEPLLLVNGFEPEPLYGVLEDRGFAYETTTPEPDRWHVAIERA